jgi:hypothetical protein
MESNELNQDLSSLDLSKYEVGDLTQMLAETGDEISEVGQHEQVSLWAEVVSGRPVDFRAFGEDEQELRVIRFGPEPTPGAPLPSPGGFRPPNTLRGAYVCTASTPMY